MPKTLYDHPLYYDILFGWDRSREAGFYHDVFAHCGVAAGERVLEVACGTGQIGRRLARRGWHVVGLDVSPSMLAFLREQADVDGVRMEVLCGDMTTFSAGVAGEFAAAFNPMSSFRLLQTDAEADAHLAAMARALRSGGVYVLDLDFRGDSREPAVTTDESWVMQRGNVTVTAEDAAVTVNDDGTEHVLAWGLEGHLRGYTVEAFAERVEQVPALQIESWHPEADRGDGDVSLFRVEHTSELPPTGRTMVVLRRR